MKRCAMLMIASLGGCVSGGGGYGPTKMPNDARTAMWSSRPTREIADCVARELHVVPVATAAGYTFTLSASGGTASYEIVPIDDDKTSYISQINGFGPLLAKGEESKISTCLLPAIPHSAND